MAINNNKIIERYIKTTQENSIIKSNTLFFFIVRNTTQNNESSVRKKNIVRGMLRHIIGNMYNLHTYAHKPEAKEEHTKTIRPSVILLSFFFIIDLTTILDHRG
jgi:hypothetical protein